MARGPFFDAPLRSLCVVGGVRRRLSPSVFHLSHLANSQWMRARVCAAVLGGTLRLSRCFTASNSCAREAWLVCTDRPAVKRTNTSTALFVALEPSTVKAACWRICAVWAVGARAHRQYPEVVARGSTEIRSVYWQVVSCADVARVHCKPIEIGRALFGCIQPPRCGYLAVMNHSYSGG